MKLEILSNLRSLSYAPNVLDAFAENFNFNSQNTPATSFWHQKTASFDTVIPTLWVKFHENAGWNSAVRTSNGSSISNSQNFFKSVHSIIFEIWICKLLLHYNSNKAKKRENAKLKEKKGHKFKRKKFKKMAYSLFSSRKSLFFFFFYSATL